MRIEDADGAHAKQIADLTHALEEARAVLLATADDAAAKEDRAERKMADLQARLKRLAETVEGGIRDRAEGRERVATFQQLLSSYPDSPDAPEAMWQLSRAFGKLEFCKDERALLRNLVERYPKSRPAVEATKALNTQKRSSDACVS
jgi:hypothetical protein